MEDEKKQPVYGIYIKNLLQKKINLSINEIGKQIKQNIENKLPHHFLDNLLRLQYFD